MNHSNRYSRELSSRIEGTRATISEVLEFEVGQEAESPERRRAILVFPDLLNIAEGRVVS